jgi:hypothetical protein
MLSIVYTFFPLVHGGMISTWANGLTVLEWMGFHKFIPTTGGTFICKLRIFYVQGCGLLECSYLAQL